MIDHYCNFSADLCKSSRVLEVLFDFFSYFDVLLKACKAGKYGENCHLNCDCGGSPCDPIHGQCICPTGKTGISCQEGILATIHYFYNL